MPTTSTTTVHRRLSSRRGSTAAPDPYGLHADINDAPDRTSSSKLTIVRVLQQPTSPPLTLNDPPSSFTSVSRRRSYRSSASGTTSPPPDGAPAGRLSFAFSSFGHEHGGGHRRDSSTGSIGGAGPPSPGGSPRLRPVGPNQSPRMSAPSNSFTKPRLNPDQLVELARQATNPRTLAQIAASANTPAPDVSPLPPGSPILRSQSPSLGHASGVVAPATFTPLPDDIYLPFVDRPGEVAQLITTPPDAKLFNLLAQTLPKVYEGPPPEPSTSPDDIQLPPDPARWTYEHLYVHLTQVDRDLESDAVWVAKAKKCILSHSELIWERIKGAFGVPPELDFIEWDWEKAERVKASLKALEAGRRGSTEKHKERMRMLREEIREGAPKPGIRGGKVVAGKLVGGDSTGWAADSAIDDEELTDDELVPPGRKGVPPPTVAPPQSATSIATADLTPDGRKPAAGHWSDWDATVDSPVHTKGTHDLPTKEEAPESEDEYDFEDAVEIEALVAPPDASSLTSPNPPPLSLGGSLVAGNPELSEGNPLGDIAEGPEEEDESELKADAGDEKKDDSAELQEEDLIPPSQIQGLRISTAPVHCSGAYGAGGVYVPHHPHHHSFPSPKPGEEPGPSDPVTIPGQAGGAKDTAGSSLHRTNSRTGSFSSLTGVTIGPFSRSESTGNLSGLSVLKPSSGSEAGDSSGYISDGALGDRLPGQPLFISNFARLNGVPTISSHHQTGGGSAASPPSHVSHGKRRVKRTGSIGGSNGSFVGTVPSSSFVGSKGVGGSLYGGSELRRTRTNSQGSTSGSLRSFK
ncbi:hypothetical protein BKA70DRAFT_1501622 [Coprinopsis sp. MPI-PUGE-AT-0042]|nr:hypothetical protein BKA70DRAFT_1501622 [Coprinopsis sp. MPI-PUGE-AT-0042]